MEQQSLGNNVFTRNAAACVVLYKLTEYVTKLHQDTRRLMDWS